MTGSHPSVKSVCVAVLFRNNHEFWNKIITTIKITKTGYFKT
jgi:hypothetical protein